MPSSICSFAAWRPWSARRSRRSTRKSRPSSRTWKACSSRPSACAAWSVDELTRVKAAYGDRRRTEIVNLQKGAKAGKALTATDLASKKFVWVGVTADGLVARTPDDKPPRPSGHDAPRWLVKATIADTIYFVSKLGKAAAVAVQLTSASREARRWLALSPGLPAHRDRFAWPRSSPCRLAVRTTRKAPASSRPRATA